MKKKSKPTKQHGKPETAKTETSAGLVRHLEFPPPEYLLTEALKEPSRKLLCEYIETIRCLRDGKGFTFREIADWLTENGVDADHNAVYRVYTKGMSDAEVAELDQTPEDE